MHDTKYATLRSVVKAALVLAHGNTGIEKRFSDRIKTITVDRTRLNECSINNFQIATDGYL